jgi:PKD repeat protein
VNASTEDYTVIILPDSVAPVAGFKADLTTTCSGTVQLRDTSWASPTAWQWSFGDGTTSLLQHPQHTYATTGTYTVSLQVQNRYGSNTAVRSGYVTVAALGTGPRPASCLPTPGTTGFYRGIGSLSIGALSSYSQGVNAPGYKDETCAIAPISLTRGVAYPVAVASAAAAGVGSDGFYNVYLWLDLNDDGAFDFTNELVGSTGPYGISQNGTLTIPMTTVLNRPLRLRVQYISRYPYNISSVIPEPCHRDEDVGQIRDFTVIATGPLAANVPLGSLAKVSVYPNPTDGHVSIRGPFLKAVEAELKTAIGQCVLRTSLNPAADGSLQLNLEAMPPGVYLLRLAGMMQAIRLIVR